MRLACLFLVAGCMTDPNGNTCAWSPGNDGFCPSDSGGGSKPKTITSYGSGTGIALAGHVLVAMTRGRTGEEPRIETSLVVPGHAPVVAPLLVDGEPLVGAIVPKLAMLGERVFLGWSDIDGPDAWGAPLAADGTMRADDVVYLGKKHCRLRRVGSRLVSIQPPDMGVVRGVWIDAEGRPAGTTVLATGISSDYLLDANSDGGGLALAFLAKKTAMESELRIARIAEDGAQLDGETGVAVALLGRPAQAQIVSTPDGGALAITESVKDLARTVSRVRVGPTGTVQVTTTSFLPAVAELARGSAGMFAVTRLEDPETRVVSMQGRLLDLNGEPVAGPFPLAGRPTDLIATAEGFALIHDTGSTVALTPAPEGIPAPAVPLAHTTVEEPGCGCQSTNRGTAGLLVIVGFLVLRRRRQRGLISI